MEWSSSVSEVSEVCAEISDFDMTETPTAASPDYADITKSALELFSPIFPKFALCGLTDIMMPNNTMYINVIFKSNDTTHTAVFSVRKLAPSSWLARFEPFLCTPQPTHDSDISWIKLAFVTFEPALFEFETRLKKWCETYLCYN